MHVPVRHGDKSRGDPFACDVDRVGIGAGVATGSVEQERNFLLFGGLTQETEDHRGDDRATRQYGAGVDRRFPEFLFLDARMIDGKSYVDDDRHLWSDARRAESGATATVADLLLGRRNGDHFRRARLLGVTL